MASKNNIRSIRFSDELAELIEAQQGRTFTEKFERLIYRCVWELPGKEAELERVQKDIEHYEKELAKLKDNYWKISSAARVAQRKLQGIEAAADEIGKELEALKV